MVLQLTNFETGEAPVLHRVPGNPLLTYAELRAGGAGVSTVEGNGATVARFDFELDRWVVQGVPGVFTDIEVVEL